MGDNSAISWTDASWNPIRSRYQSEHTVPMVQWGCLRISPGCDNCYASTLHVNHGGSPYEHEGGLLGARLLREGLQLHEATLLAPLRWRRPRKVFLSSMTDIFGDWVDDAWLSRMFAVMALAPQHTFQVLTKRAKRMRDFVGERGVDAKGDVETAISHLYDAGLLRGADDDRVHELIVDLRWPLPNVWLGVSVESQAFAWRLNYLVETPAAVRFVSAEPLLGPLNLVKWMVPEGHFCRTDHVPQTRETELALMDMYRAAGRKLGANYLDWVISGGESGPGFRSADPDWFRSLRDQCQAAGVAYFHKQAGGPKAGTGTLLDGREWHAFPNVAA